MKTTHRNFSALKTLRKTDKSTFRPSGINNNKEAQQNEGKPSSCPGTKCSNCNTIRKTQTNRLNSQGLVAQPTGSFRTRTSHVSFPVRTFPGTPCPGSRDSLVPPLPPPRPAGRERDFITRNLSLRPLHLQVPVGNPTVHLLALWVSRCWKMPEQAFAARILHTNRRLAA